MICKAIYCQVQNYPLMTRHTKIVNDINCSTNIWNEALSKIRQWTLRRKMNFNFNLISRLKNSYFPVKWKLKIIHHYISVNIWDECYFNPSPMGVFFSNCANDIKLRNTSHIVKKVTWQNHHMMLLNTKLDIQNRIKNISNKENRSIKVLSELQNVLPRPPFLIISKSLIRPHKTYKTINCNDSL